MSKASLFLFFRRCPCQEIPFDRVMKPSYSEFIMPRFIAVEGLDGAGTSTQSHQLAANLEAKGWCVHVHAEPTAGPAGLVIRDILSGKLTRCEDRGRTDQLLAHLFAADRFDHLYNDKDGVAKLTGDGAVVMTTRYFFSSYAYNARTQEDFDLVDRLNRHFPLPELVIFLHVPVEVSLERLAQRAAREHYENEAELRRVAANFERILEPLGDRVLRFDCTQSVEETASEISGKVLQRITKWSKVS